MTTLLKYAIEPPTNVIEASLTREPDDISTAYVRINVRNAGTRHVTAKKVAAIKFRIRYASSAEEDDDALQEALTRNPRSITPVAREFEEWTITGPVQTQEGDVLYADFTATPNKSVALKKRDSASFYLYDIEVVDRDGVTEIEVNEIDEDGNETAFPDPADLMKIRKSYPSLRIDYFTANKLSDVVSDDDATSSPVELSWATTGATDILLSSITEADRNIADNPSATKDAESGNSYWITENVPRKRTVAGKRVIDRRTAVFTKDGSFRVNPQTTTTYTLRALRRGDPTRSGEEAPERDLTKFPLAIQQLTVIVTDQTVTPKLIIGDADNAELHDGNLTLSGEVTANNIKTSSIGTKDGDEEPLDITANTISAGGLLRAGSIRVESSVSTETGALVGSIILGKGTTPAGTIVMWSGPAEGEPAETVPTGWILCDEEKRVKCWDEKVRTVPDLRDRFILGKGKREVGAGQDGKESVKLDTANLPSHSHGVKVDSGEQDVGAHTHDVSVTVPIFDVSSEENASFGPMIFKGADRGDLTHPSADGSAASSGGHSHTIKIEAAGNSNVTAHNNMPPYYVLAFIMYHGLEKVTLADEVTPPPEEN